MTEQEIVEGNKLIAEFCGLVYGKAFKAIDGRDDQEKTYLESWHDINGRRFDELKYHSSWDWLMPVVEKIYSMSYNESNNRFAPSVERFLENDIHSIWKQVVEFIKWYNQQKNL